MVHGETPFDLGAENEIGMGQTGNVDQRSVAAVCLEMMKMFKGKGIAEENNGSVRNHASTSAYADPIMVHLPDGRTLKVTIVGEVGLTPSLILSDVFYVPETLPLNKLWQLVRVPNVSTFANLCPSCFAASIAEFQKSHKLSSPFTVLNKAAYSNVVNTESNLDIQLFHDRLGHTFVSKLVHIPEYDKTRATWTYLIHSKDQIPALLVTFLAYIDNHFKAKPKFIRTDNGTEVINKSCAALFKTKGILHQKSMPYTPQQNGVVERKHRHLLETARSLRVHANLPIKFWGESITKPHKDKFDNRGLKCVLIDSPSNQKGYQLYNLDTKEVFVSRDVVFQENVFPFKEPAADIPFHPTPEFPVFGDSEAIEEPFVSPTPLPQSNPNIKFDHPNSPSSLADIQQHTSNEPQPQNVPPAPARKQPQYPLFGKADFAGLTATHIAFLANVFAHSEPHNYKQAMIDKGWVEAINKELQALEKNNTWELTTLPAGHKPITLKWVFKIKYYPDGSLDKLKARLVVRDFNQKEGLDYKHTFSPVAKLATVKVLVALATAKEWDLHQLDINNAFIHGYIDEEIYMVPPEGYTKAAPNQSKHDYSFFVKNTNGKFTAVLVYVDDMLITGDCQQEILSLKQALHQKFTIKDLGLAKYFIGIELCRTSAGTYLNKRKYILDLLSDTVSRSSTEDEYKSMAATTCELLLLSYWLKDLNIPTHCSVTLFCDNKSSQQIAANPYYHDRTKHLDIDCHFTRDKVQDGFLQTTYIPTQS
ncbi:retrovirus-related pol polyprotein from transposon TNT 1-94 [Tanacetum coccineum]|uniref:Retrovirus-related pol polyprotein from transposon TNT 1-94 n=1 Tax=Tanacetum coccineum TaxID=301880 RepID=A0ABQ4XQN1_9ASTR